MSMVRLTFPQLKGQRFAHSSNECVILNPKLNWELNTELRIKKAGMTFYACKSTFIKKWSLRRGYFLESTQPWFVPS